MLKQKKTKKLHFLLLFAAVSLISCGTRLPPIPAHDEGTLIDDNIPYGYFVPYYNDSKPYKTTLQQFLDKKVVCVSADDYGKLKKYSQNVLAIIKSKCPQIVK
jgi:hypothetical protein